MNEMECRRFDSSKIGMFSGSYQLFYESPFCFSVIDATNKSTAECECCVAPILALTSASCKKELSMIGHISPEVVTIKKTKERFCTKYSEILLNAKQQAVPGSMEMHLVGGRQGKELHVDWSYTKEYIEMIKLLGALTEEHLEITLQVKSGPKTSGKTTVAFGTENRVIAISEPMPDEQAWMPFNYRNIDAIEAMYS
jgi:hypothetical protein